MIPRFQSLRYAQSRKPRASGDDPQQSSGQDSQYSVNPARAGMIPHSPLRSTLMRGKPRASGDDPWPLSTFQGAAK